LIHDLVNVDVIRNVHLLDLLLELLEPLPLVLPVLSKPDALMLAHLQLFFELVNDLLALGEALLGEDEFLLEDLRALVRFFELLPEGMVGGQLLFKDLQFVLVFQFESLVFKHP
jgi:hypothetical protein